jgi:hypothetical protein
MTGLDDAGIRLSYQLAMAGQVQHLEVRSDESSPLAAIGCLLNNLGAEGWELITYDTTTNRGVLKRVRPEPEAPDAA